MGSYYIRRGHWVDAPDAKAAAVLFDGTQTDITEVIDDTGAISVVHGDGSTSKSAPASHVVVPDQVLGEDDEQL